MVSKPDSVFIMDEPARSYPNLGQSLAITAIVLSSQFLIGLSHPFLTGILGSTAALFSVYLVSMSLSLWIIMTLAKMQGDPKRFKLEQINFKTTFLIIITTIAFLLGIIYPISLLIPVSETAKAIFRATFQATDLFLFLSVVVAAPILEELIFRGILLDGLLKKYAPFLAILISSLLFGVFHIIPRQIITAFLGGIFIAWTYYQFKNLWYCILIHFVVNLFGFAMMTVIGIEQMIEMDFGNTYLRIEGGVVIFIALVIFAFCINMLKSKINSSRIS